MKYNSKDVPDDGVSRCVNAAFCVRAFVFSLKSKNRVKRKGGRDYILVRKKG